MEIHENTSSSPLPFRIALLLLFLLALGTRSAGLFHGLEGAHTYHPDTLKQVVAARNFLQGQMLWYTGSLAYDGYPYGLNHVDAALTRIVWPVFTAITHTLHPGLSLPNIPSLGHLMILCRIFRVVYGMAAFALLAWLLHRRRIKPAARLAWLTVAALAPVSTVVTHGASGDVGTDLFVLAALAVLPGGLPRPGSRRFGLCGLFLGCAFAVKYHAILAGVAPGLLWLALPLPARDRVKTALATAGGFLAGFVLLTPQMWIRPKKTISLIGDNIGYIRNYNADPAFLEQALPVRLFASLSSNLPLLVRALGPALCLAALVALLVGVFRGARARALRKPGLAWDLSLLAMGVGVALISIATKPHVQPFHFSFLIFPLVLGTAGIWTRTPFRGSTAGLALLLAVQCLGDLSRQRDEVTFWTRESTERVRGRLARELVEPSKLPESHTRIGTLIVEGENPSVFRNRPKELVLPDASPWRRFPMEALPATPYVFSPDWVFLDLPFFPRDDRLMRVSTKDPVDRFIISKPTNAPIPLDMRAGELPSELRITWNGRTRRHSLRPHQRLTLDLPVRGGVAFSRDGKSRVRHRLRISSRPGDLLARIGPAPRPPGRMRPPPAEKLARARFLEGRFRIGLGTNHQIVRESVHLPPARYRLEISPAAPDNLPVLEIDNAQLPHPDFRRTSTFLPLENGKAETEIALPRPGLFSRITLRYAQRPSHGVEWTLKPVRPLQEPPPLEDIPARRPFHPRVEFRGSNLRLGSIELLGPDRTKLPDDKPIPLSSGDPLRLSLTADFQGGAWDLRDSHVVFLHLLDGDHRQVFAKDIRLEEIPVTDLQRTLVWDLGELDLPPGDYHVGIGVYNPATQVRLKPGRLHAAPLPDRRSGLFILRIKDPNS